MWDELPLSTTTDAQLHPYTEWCPGNPLDFHTMETILGLANIPYGSEVMYRENPAEPTGSSRKKTRKPMVDNIATVAKLHELGVLTTQGKQDIENLKAIYDKQIEKAEEARERVPFAITQRVLGLYIRRWTIIQRALEIVARPYNPYGQHVVNAPFELEERKRKAEASLGSSTPKSANADDIEQEQDDTDRQNPEGSGGNVV